MMKASPSRLATSKRVLLFPRSQSSPRSSQANNTLLLSFLLVSDSFPHSPSVLPGFTFWINYLPQILVSGYVFWGIQHQVMQPAEFCHAADFDSEPRAITLLSFFTYLNCIFLSSVGRDKTEVKGENGCYRKHSWVFWMVCSVSISSSHVLRVHTHHPAS